MSRKGTFQIHRNFALQFIIFFIQLAVLGTASPIHPSNTSWSSQVIDQNKVTATEEDSDWNWKLEDLNNEFKGIFWDDAFKDCSKPRLDKLIFATRAAMWMLDSVDTDNSYAYSAAWNRYFGDYDIWMKSGPSKLTVAAHIQHNILQVIRFPKHGHHKSKSDQKKIHYTCRPQDHPRGKVICESGITAAVTFSAAVTAENVYVIGFCDTFFESTKMRYLEERVKGERKSYAHISDLDVYERTIIHEFMHVDIIGFKPGHINDVQGSLRADSPNDIVAIYGESRCRDFARRDIKNKHGSPNTAVVTNADNYSWFFLYHYFDKQWNWHADRKHDELKKEQPEEYITPGSEPGSNEEVIVPIPSSSVLESELVIPEEIPLNCKLNEPSEDVPYPMFTCRYIGGDMETWDKPYPSEGGCELSFECRTSFGPNAVDPQCTCRCGGEVTPLRDDRCAGFAGALPGRSVA